jgi:hypothetical protein
MMKGHRNYIQSRRVRKRKMERERVQAKAQRTSPLDDDLSVTTQSRADVDYGDMPDMILSDSDDEEETDFRGDDVLQTRHMTRIFILIMPTRLLWGNITRNIIS